MSDFNIKFFTLNISNPLSQKKQARTWLLNIIQKKNKLISSIDIDFIFCNDEYLLELNNTYLKKQTFTDVIAFDYSEGNSVKGDVFISYERVKENAVIYKQKTQTELLRVMIHGVLHLIGYKDKTENEKRIMTSEEDFCLKLYKKLFNQ